MTKFHYSVLSQFRTKTYADLLDKRYLSRTTPKEFEFKQDFNYKPLQAYSFVRDNSMFLLKKDDFDKLPIKVKSTTEMILKNDDIVQVIKEQASFKVTARKDMIFREIILMDNLKHEAPEDWILWKIVCWSAVISRIALRVCSKPAFAKTSYFDILHYLLDKAYVLPRPKTIPGIARGFSEDGVLVLDEMGHLKSEIKGEISSVLFQLGGMSNYVTLGTAGSAAYHTLPKYDTPMLSVVCLFNRLQDYEEQSEFFDYMFPNNTAICNRLLPLKLPDAAIDMEQFITSTHVLTEDDIQYFYKVLRTHRYMRQAWDNRLLDCFTMEERVNRDMAEKFPLIHGRHCTSFRNILLFIVEYCEGNEQEYILYSEKLYKWYNDYIYMLRSLNNDWFSNKGGAL